MCTRESLEGFVLILKKRTDIWVDAFQNQTSSKICFCKVLINNVKKFYLTLSSLRYSSFRNQSINHKSIDWFLYDRNLRHERVYCSIMEVATFTRGAFCENFNLVLFMDLICVKPATLLKHSSMDVFHAF